MGGTRAPCRRGRLQGDRASDVTVGKPREIVAAARIKPAVVQVESHPYLPEWELLDFSREQGLCSWLSRRLGIPWNLSSPTTGDHRDFRACAHLCRLKCCCPGRHSEALLS